MVVTNQMSAIPIKGGSLNGTVANSRKRVIRLRSRSGKLEEYKLVFNRTKPVYVFNRVVGRRRIKLNEKRQVTNLQELASDLAREEGLGKSIGVAQMAEVLGLLGERWRGMSQIEILVEVSCIRDRAGLRSAHRDK